MNTGPKFCCKTALALFGLFFVVNLLVVLSYIGILPFVVLFITFEYHPIFYGLYGQPISLLQPLFLALLILSSFALALFATKHLWGLKLALLVSALETVLGLLLFIDTYLYLSMISAAAFVQLPLILFGVVAFYCALKSKPLFVAGK